MPKATDHLSPEQLYLLAHRAIGREEAAELLMHLSICQRCLDEMARQEPMKGPSFLQLAYQGRTRVPRATQATEGEDYRQAIDRLLQEDAEAVRQLDEIMRMPRHQRPLILRNQRTYHKLGLVRRLLVEAKAKFQVHGAAAEELARLGLLLSEQLDDDLYLPELIAGQEVLGRGYIGNALRAQRRFSAAETELSTAWKTLEERIPGAKRERAWLLRYRGALWRDVHRFGEARQATRESRDLFLRLGEQKEGLWMAAAEAIVLEEAGDPSTAFEVLSMWSPDLTEENLGLAYFTCVEFLRTLLLVRLGRSTEAHRRLPRLQDLNARTRGAYYPRLLWIEALLRQGLDQGKRARACLEEALEIFVGKGRWLDGALVTLDLAQLCLQRNRLLEGARLARIAAPIFQTHGQARHALTALQLHLQATQG